MTEVDLRSLTQIAKIRLPLSIPTANQRAHRVPGINSMVFGYKCIRAGVHLPLCPYLVGILNYFNLCPFQVNPNGYRAVLRLNLMYMKLGYDPLSNRIPLLLRHQTQPPQAQVLHFLDVVRYQQRRRITGQLG